MVKVIGQIFASESGVSHFNALAGMIPCQYRHKWYIGKNKIICLSTGGQGTNWRRNIDEKFNRLNVTDDRQTDRQTDGRWHIANVNSREFTFAKKITPLTKWTKNYENHEHQRCHPALRSVIHYSSCTDSYANPSRLFSVSTVLVVKLDALVQVMSRVVVSVVDSTRRRIGQCMSYCYQINTISWFSH